MRWTRCSSRSDDCPARNPPIRSRQNGGWRPAFNQSLLKLGAFLLIEDGAEVHDAVGIESFLEFLEHVVRRAVFVPGPFAAVFSNAMVMAHRPAELKGFFH